ncbi:hypothetical protein P4O66_007277, partial [Electrophorus voltai]
TMLNNMALAKTLLCLTVITIVHCDFSIKMPSMLEALNGTCIMIPCQFSIPEDQKTKLQLPVTGVWRKASRWFFGSVDIFNSSQKANKLDGKILGDLTQKNCTSVLYNIHSSLSDSYYFRLETGFKYTFETPVWISVKDTLPEPILSRVDISVNEGAEVEIICTAMVPCPQYPPNLTWVPLLGNCTETMEKQADGTFTLSSVLRFVSSHVNHEQRISCTVDYPLQTSGGHNVYESTATITVLYFFQSSTTMWQLLGWGGAALTLITILTFTLCIKRRRSRFIQQHMFASKPQQSKPKMTVVRKKNSIKLRGSKAQKCAEHSNNECKPCPLMCCHCFVLHNSYL